MSSGLIAGEGIMGVLVAAYAFFAEKPQGIGRAFRGSFGEFVALGVVWAVGILFKWKEKSQLDDK